MSRFLLLLIAGGVLAACGHQPYDAASMDRPTMQVFDPANGLAYALPCAACPASSDDGLKVTAAAVEPTPPQAYRPTLLAAASVDASTAIPDVVMAAAASSRATTDSAALPAPRLKLDTELASVTRMVPFAFGRSNLGSHGQRAVRELVPLAKQSERVYVRGRTDASGSHSANKYVADKRATTVRQAFVAGGVPAAKIQTTYCTDCFIASNGTHAGRRGNRRVDVELVMTRQELARLPKPVHALEYPGDPPLSLSLSGR